MATYTPNLNLGKPEATDPFGNFRQLFNDNMDILDNGGGGSSTLAGLSDVDITTPSDGESLVYDSNSQKWVNGNVSGGGGGILLNQTLTFVGTTATITDSRVTADSRVFVYYHDTSLDEALACGLDADTSANTITFEANTAPQGTIVCDIVIDGGVGNGFIGIADCYSKEEKEVGCFIDGKPLYQKTIPLTTGNSNTYITYLTDISNPETMMIDFAGSFYITGTASVPAIPYFGTLNASADTNAFAVLCNVDNNKLRLDYRVGTSAYSKTAYVTVLYTKTTDTAGSGTWTPSGVPTIHYSTSEQVIGTWLGQTLYEKVFTISEVTVSANSWYEITSIDVSNISQLVSNKCLLTRNGMEWGLLSTQKSANNKLNVLNPRNANIAFDTIVLQYTKSS